MLRDFGEVRAAKLGDRAVVLVNEQPADVAGELFCFGLALLWLVLRVTRLLCGLVSGTGSPKNSYADLEQQLWLFDDTGQITLKQEREARGPGFLLNNRSYLSTVERNYPQL